MSVALFWFLLIATTYRLSILIGAEEGPFSIFFRLRRILGAYDYGENGEPETAWGRGVSCPSCVGMYVSVLSALFAIYWLNLWRIEFFLVIWLGLSGVVTFLYRMESRYG